MRFQGQKAERTEGSGVLFELCSKWHKKTLEGLRKGKYMIQFVF